MLEPILNCFEATLVTSPWILIKKTKRSRASNLTLCLIHVLALQLVLFPVLADGRQAAPAQAKQPLGSLSGAGQVYVNNSVAPAESTLFTGDTLRTDDTSTATFTVSGQGSFQIAARSQLVFTGNQQYVAELKAGIAVMSSSGGPSSINLRVGNFVVVAVTQNQQSTATIESAADGSFFISCSEGSVGIVPLEGPPNGIFVQAGQSVSISPQGQLSVPTATVASTAPPTSPTQPTPVAKKSHTGWIIFGVVGGGAVAAAAATAAALAAHGAAAAQTVSPSSP